MFKNRKGPDTSSKYKHVKTKVVKKTLGAKPSNLWLVKQYLSAD